jgi:transcriptional regulator with XRE-family HTH domain
MNEFHKRLVKLLADKKLKQSDLVKIKGITYSYASRLCRGETKPGIDIIEKITQGLNLTEQELFSLVVGEVEDLDAALEAAYNDLDDGDKICVDKIEKTITDKTQLLDIIKALKNN